MAITHVNTQIATGVATTSTAVVTKPTGLAVGDVMVAFVNANLAGITAPSGQGWTRLSTVDGAAGALYRFEVWYVVATSTHTAASTFTWTNGDSSSPMWAAISAYRGVDQNTPINASSQASDSTTSNPVTGPSITTTKRAWIIHARVVRNNASGAIATFSSGATNERFDGGNHGASIAYSGAAYDSGSETASGSISGISITNSGSSETNAFSTTIALQTADTSITPGAAAATAAAYGPTVATGIAAAAGKASVTATVQQASAGHTAPAGVAAATVAVKDVGRRIAAGTAAAATAASGLLSFLGTPGYRTNVIEAESRSLVVADESRTCVVDRETRVIAIGWDDQ